MLTPLSLSLVLHLIAGGLYAGLSFFAWRNLLSATARENQSFAQTGLISNQELSFLSLALALHGFAILEDMFGLRQLHFGFALALSFMLWTGLSFFFVESRWVPIAGMRLVLFPLAALVCGLVSLFPPVHLILNTDSLVFRSHIAIALAAYSVMTIAALHALLMAIAERGLQAMGRLPGFGSSLWVRLLESLPALLVLEDLLFRLIRVGFALLTATLISGIWFSEIRWGAWLRVDHKNIFSLLSWLVFGGLLLGRWQYGWRGKLALRWTLAGFTLLLLSYVGSGFVFEVLLKRG